MANDPNSRTRSQGGAPDLAEFFKDKVKPRLSPELIYEGVEFHNAGRFYNAKCPLHHGNNLKFTVNIETLQWKCWSKCADHGDPIEFIRKRYGMGFVDAIQYLASKAGVPMPGETVAPDFKMPEIKHVDTIPLEEGDVQDRFRTVLEITYKLALDLYPGSEGEKYMLDQGITNGRGILGWLPTPELIKEKLTANQLSDAYRLNLLGTQRDGEFQGEFRFLRRVLFPYHWNGKLTCLHGRTIDPADDKNRARHAYTKTSVVIRNKEKVPVKEIRWQRGCFNEKALDARQVVLLEGAKDCLAAEIFGYKNAVAMGGTDNGEVIKRLVAKGEGLDLVKCGFDRDEAGEKAFLGLIEIFGPKVRRLLPPPLDPKHPAKDWAEAALLARRLSVSDDSSIQL